MFEIPSLRDETRYGMPAADRLLFNRRYVVGYSYLFRQPRWALELINRHTKQMADQDLKRLNNFREDPRVPEMFRSTLATFEGSKHDRGHLISSADRLEDALINSETFLMSNMSPQVGKFNRGVWKKLESAVRKLSRKKIMATVGKVKKKVWKYAEVYVICGPVFEIGSKLEVIGDPKEIKVVIPHAFFKSVLAEQRMGKLELWSFLIPNEDTKQDPSNFLLPTVEVERRAGLELWDRLRGSEIDKLKAAKGKIWS